MDDNVLLVLLPAIPSSALVTIVLKNLHIKSKQTISFRFVQHWKCDAIVISSAKCFCSVVFRFQIKNKTHKVTVFCNFFYRFAAGNELETGNIQCWLPSFRHQMQSLRPEAIQSDSFQVLFIIIQSFIDQIIFNWWMRKKIFQLTMRVKLWKREKSTKERRRKKTVYKLLDDLCVQRKWIPSSISTLGDWTFRYWQFLDVTSIFDSNQRRKIQLMQKFSLPLPVCVCVYFPS